jgi:hypothetical protein
MLTFDNPFTSNLAIADLGFLAVSGLMWGLETVQRLVDAHIPSVFLQNES